ncbi:MAG TPA: GDP-mannose 4,6-dehydratase [bacterium]|nr:GDP-mannose 4,6-dehydratase [bacterium]
MKALVTGGAGFIGSHLVEALLARGDSVSVIDDLSTGRFENIAHLEGNPNFDYVIDTILDERVVGDMMKSVDVVFHLAAAVGVAYIIDNPLKSLETNIRGTEIVLQKANDGKKMVVLFSTSEIYGKANSQPCGEEDDRVLGTTTITRWGYSSSKAIDEFLALAYHREKKLPIRIVRCFNTCGPRQTGQYGMVIPRFVKRALLDHPITVHGDGKQTRCFCDVSDAVRGVLGLVDEPAANGEVFNLGSDEETTINDLALMVKELTSSKSAIEHIPYERAYEEGFEDMRRRVPDLSKIRETIGYEPRVSLSELLARVVEDFEK